MTANEREESMGYEEASSPELTENKPKGGSLGDSGSVPFYCPKCGRHDHYEDHYGVWCGDENCRNFLGVKNARR